MRELGNFIRRSGNPITIHDAVTATQTAPAAATAGAKLGAVHSSGLLGWKAHGAATITSASVYGRTGDGEPWMLVGEANGGNQIDLTADIGFEERIALGEYLDLYLAFTYAGPGAVTVVYEGEERY
jgi:hypothetical protein